MILFLFPTCIFLFLKLLTECEHNISSKCIYCITYWIHLATYTFFVTDHNIWKFNLQYYQPWDENVRYSFVFKCDESFIGEKRVCCEKNINLVSIVSLLEPISSFFVFLFLILGSYVFSWAVYNGHELIKLSQQHGWDAGYSACNDNFSIMASPLDTTEIEAVIQLTLETSPIASKKIQHTI